MIKCVYASAHQQTFLLFYDLRTLKIQNPSGATLHIWNFIAKYTLCNIVSAIIELTYLAYISGNFHKIITKVVPDPMFSRSRNTLKYMQYNRMYCNIQPKYNLIYNRHIYSICTIYAIQLLFSLSRISIDTLFGSWITHSSYKLWSTSHHIASCTVAANS